MPVSNRNILVSGGGVAGSALAVAKGTRLMGRLGIRPPVETVGGGFALERYAGILDT